MMAAVAGAARILDAPIEFAGSLDGDFMRDRTGIKYTRDYYRNNSR